LCCAHLTARVVFYDLFITTQREMGQGVKDDGGEGIKTHTHTHTYTHTLDYAYKVSDMKY
jgi:hypothetical protein